MDDFRLMYLPDVNLGLLLKDLELEGSLYRALSRAGMLEMSLHELVTSNKEEISSKLRGRGSEIDRLNYFLEDNNLSLGMPGFQFISWVQ